MTVVVDTNVLISGIFFGGAPWRVVNAVSKGEVQAAATPEIVGEYIEVVDEMIARGQGHLRKDGLDTFLTSLEFVMPKTNVAVCRDPDDDKFIGCAIDADALYIVSGDKDLLSMESYRGVQMISAAEFCESYLF